MRGTMTQAKRQLRSRREAAPVPQYSQDEIAAAIAAEARVKNSYLTLARYMQKHRGCTDEDVMPADGTMIYNLWLRGKLTRRQLIAWNMFWNDVEESYGASGPLSVSYAERVSTSVAGAPRTVHSTDEPFNAIGLADVRMASWNSAYASMTQKLDALRREERGIMDQLIRDHIRVVKGVRGMHSHDIAYIGGHLSGYKDNRQAIAAGVSRIQAMLNNLADMYMV